MQTGQSIQPARDKFGDFDELFIKSMGIDAKLCKTFRIYHKPELPKPKDLMGILITGSPSMVTECNPWCKMTQQWLQQFVTSSLPILGVCYGHQLLALMLGGEVAWNPKGREMGQIHLNLCEKAYQDKLFGPLLKPSVSELKLQASHQQAVIKLPPNTTLLGSTKLDANHCFCYQNHIWGFQFHPELTPEIISHYITIRQNDIKQEGLDPQALLNNIRPIDNGIKLLQQFKKLCMDYAQSLNDSMINRV